MEELKAMEEERGKMEKGGDREKEKAGGMATSQTRLSDTAHQ